MRITTAEPWTDSAGVAHAVTEYEIRGHSQRHVRGSIRGETRRTRAGEPVVWDLVLMSRDSYRWHRTDWFSPWGYTAEVRRCPWSSDSSPAAAQGPVRSLLEDLSSPAAEDEAPPPRDSAIITSGDGRTPTGEPYLAAAVDEIPQPRPCGLPLYPPKLAAAGVSGSVVLRFVIDTEGRVEPASISVDSASNQAFAQAGTSFIRACTYSPGLVKGRPVRTLVEQRISFTQPP